MILNCILVIKCIRTLIRLPSVALRQTYPPGREKNPILYTLKFSLNTHTQRLYEFHIFVWAEYFFQSAESSTAKIVFPRRHRTRGTFADEKRKFRHSSWPRKSRIRFLGSRTITAVGHTINCLNGKKPERDPHTLCDARYPQVRRTPYGISMVVYMKN